jgi:hypothetical protein
MVSATIHSPYYDIDGRKYIDVIFNSEIIKLKIPFRYGRVMCKVNGLKTIQELKKGEIVDIDFSKKVWNGSTFFLISSIQITE